jgi:hypothetical protein
VKTLNSLLWRRPGSRVSTVLLAAALIAAAPAAAAGPDPSPTPAQSYAPDPYPASHPAPAAPAATQAPAVVRSVPPAVPSRHAVTVKRKAPAKKPAEPAKHRPVFHLPSLPLAFPGHAAPDLRAVAGAVVEPGRDVSLGLAIALAVLLALSATFVTGVARVAR